MGRTAKAKFTFGEKTKELFQSVQNTLKERGAPAPDMGELVEAIILSNSGLVQNTVNTFVIEKTPMNYKVQKLLENEAASKELNKLAKKHDFGLNLGT